jgi:hypothetical protein
MNIARPRSVVIVTERFARYGNRFPAQLARIAELTQRTEAAERAGGLGVDWRLALALKRAHDSTKKSLDDLERLSFKWQIPVRNIQALLFVHSQIGQLRKRVEGLVPVSDNQSAPDGLAEPKSRTRPIEPQANAARFLAAGKK